MSAPAVEYLAPVGRAGESRRPRLLRALHGRPDITSRSHPPTPVRERRFRSETRHPPSALRAPVGGRRRPRSRAVAGATRRRANKSGSTNRATHPLRGATGPDHGGAPDGGATRSSANRGVAAPQWEEPRRGGRGGSTAAGARPSRPCSHARETWPREMALGVHRQASPTARTRLRGRSDSGETGGRGPLRRGAAFRTVYLTIRLRNLSRTYRHDRGASPDTGPVLIGRSPSASSSPMVLDTRGRRGRRGRSLRRSSRSRPSIVHAEPGGPTASSPCPARAAHRAWVDDLPFTVNGMRDIAPLPAPRSSPAAAAGPRTPGRSGCLSAQVRPDERTAATSNKADDGEFGASAPYGRPPPARGPASRRSFGAPRVSRETEAAPHAVRGHYRIGDGLAGLNTPDPSAANNDNLGLRSAVAVLHETRCARLRECRNGTFPQPSCGKVPFLQKGVSVANPGGAPSGTRQRLERARREEPLHAPRPDPPPEMHLEESAATSSAAAVAARCPGQHRPRGGAGRGHPTHALPRVTPPGTADGSSASRCHHSGLHPGR
ncbi:hypothetical protein Psed_6684 [Pseudonocardia dioxanivorans CB1190]|uniref:Uncharacterized protein n=1 Tax=Pseudonocardia dioxanivorans (strain ATCC 55486 / DSM 44775 / JCM 13855 / CB1190) TaxID=675635 RepID=F4CXW6_PSEUX|nr:hypothetical protein Psed_6684 [Pseudonocardia dioxanivorans CB1190]